MGWDTSNRRDGLPRWWPVSRQRILNRDPVCRCPGCIKCTEMHRSCSRPAAEVDHIGAPDDHRDIALLGKCRACHGRKSSGEGVAARAAKKAPSNFFAETHPGRL